MSKYQITQTVSGVVLGIYDGETPEQALDAMAQDQGYRDYAELLSVTGETSETDTLNVQPARGIDYSTNRLGDVTIDGKLIHLTQQAYADNYGTDGAVRYYAAGVDNEGNDYRVAWDTTDAWDAQQAAYRADPDNFEANIGEEDACDWSSPVAATLV